MSPPSAVFAVPSDVPAAVAASVTASPVAADGVAEATSRRGALGTTAILALAAVYIIWGSTYLVMRIAVETLPPMLMGAARFTIAGCLLLAIGRHRVGRLPTWAEWRAAAPIGALLFVGGNGLVAFAETSVSSGIAAVVVATMPLWMAVFATMLGERPRGREWLGIAVGVSGVVILMSGAELSASPSAALVLALSPMAWALGSTLGRRAKLAPGLLGSATQQLTGGLAMIAVGLLRGERWPATMTFDGVWTLTYLIVFGSLIAFTAYAWLLRNARPAVATSYAFVNPPLAVLLGAALGAEAIGTTTLIATPVVVAAVVLVVGRPRPRS